MITGAHSILYSRDAERDRAFLKHVLRLPSVDVGGGWLIFGLPPAEVAVHPGEKNDVHEFYLMTADVRSFVRTLQAQGVACSTPETMSWGVLTHVTLPGGGRLGVYQARHARPRPMRARHEPPAGGTRASKPRPRARAGSAGRRRARR